MKEEKAEVKITFNPFKAVDLHVSRSFCCSANDFSFSINGSFRSNNEDLLNILIKN